VREAGRRPAVWRGGALCIACRIAGTGALEGQSPRARRATSRRVVGVSLAGEIGASYATTTNKGATSGGTPSSDPQPGVHKA
jgi:hypothetical protein